MKSEQVAVAALVGGGLLASLMGEGADGDDGSGEHKGVPCPECGERVDSRGLYPHLNRGHDIDPERASELTENTLHDN